MSFEVNRRLAARRPPLASGASVDPVTAGIVRGAFDATATSTFPAMNCLPSSADATAATSSAS